MVEYVTKNEEYNQLTILSPYKDAQTLMDSYSLSQSSISTLQSQCENQLVQNISEVQNFNLVGVILIVVITVLLTILNYTMESILDLISAMRHGKDHNSASKCARQADDKLHLLRLALPGEIGWELASSGVPTHPYTETTIVRPLMLDGMTYYPQAPQSPDAGGLTSDFDNSDKR